VSPIDRGLGVAAGLEPDVASELGRRCVELGYRSLWSNDHPMSSGLETAARFARAAPALDVGVAVLPLDRHDAPSVARSFSELGLDPARLWLGIGAGFSKRPLSVMREGLETMRSTVPDQTRLAVAAMGPKMCALAGARADAAFLNWMTPEKAAWARDRVHEGASEAGRSEPPPIFAYVRVAVGADARERLLKEESFYRQLHPGYIRHFESLGSEPGTVGIAASDADDVAEQLDRYREAVDQVVVRALAHADVQSLSAVAEAAAPRL
jgi:alkanesulfonate monooxygenase SsuD/methylene tetrahydromethanopterin reductase-like flavin-dependent oxidoreductase (luciferase family)